VTLAPTLDRGDHAVERAAGAGQRVAGPRRHGRLHPLGHDAELGELVEPLRQRRRVAAADGAGEVVEAARTAEQGAHDLQRPLALQHLHGVVDGAELGTVGGGAAGHPLQPSPAATL
jgi:hypothetical protein